MGVNCLVVGVNYIFPCVFVKCLIYSIWSQTSAGRCNRQQAMSFSSCRWISDHQRISPYFTQIFYPPEIRTNFGEEMGQYTGGRGFRTEQNIAKYRLKMACFSLENCQIEQSPFQINNAVFYLLSVLPSTKTIVQFAIRNHH